MEKQTNAADLNAPRDTASPDPLLSDEEIAHLQNLNGVELVQAHTSIFKHVLTLYRLKLASDSLMQAVSAHRDWE